MIAAAKEKPCVDCGGVFHPTAMEFDHLPQFIKCFDLSSWKMHNLKAVQAELEKCEIVCANCHRTRTAQRKTKTVKPGRIGPQRPVGRPAHQRYFAVEWLKKFFQDGFAHRSVVLLRAAKNAHISDDTLKRAAGEIGVIPFKYGPFWYWKLTRDAVPNLFEEEI